MSLTLIFSASTWPNIKSKVSFEILRSSRFQNFPYFLNSVKIWGSYCQKTKNWEILCYTLYLDWIIPIFAPTLTWMPPLPFIVFFANHWLQCMPGLFNAELWALLACYFYREKIERKGIYLFIFAVKWIPFSFEILIFHFPSFRTHTVGADCFCAWHFSL